MKKILTITFAILFAITLNAQTVYLSEDFESGTIPTGWTIEDSIPPEIESWIVTTDGSAWEWIVPAHTNYACIRDQLNINSSDQTLPNSMLISPEIDLSSATHPALSMKHLLGGVSGQGTFSLQASTDNGATWNQIVEIEQQMSISGNYVWEEKIINLAFVGGESSVKLAFKYQDNFSVAVGWAIDDISIYEAAVHDLGISQIIFPPTTGVEITTAPKVNITNFGLNDETTYSVSLSDGASYNETVNVTSSIATGATSTVVFPTWTAPNTESNYTFTATVTVADDAIANNNVMQLACTVKQFNAFVNNFNKHTWGGVDMNNGYYADLCSNNLLVLAEEWDGTDIYRIYSDLKIGKVSTNGTYTHLGQLFIPGFGGRPVGLAYNWDTDEMYVAINNMSDNYKTNFFKVDLNTLALTQIGIQCQTSVQGIDFAEDGFIYGPTKQGKLYKYDPATAAETQIGDVGFGIDGEQAVAYDFETHKLYTYTNGIFADAGFKTRFGYYDLTSGAFNEMTAISSSHFISSFVILGSPTSDVPDLSSEEISISPNPTSNIVNIKAKGNYNVNIIDITGKVIHTQNITDNAYIDISHLKSGMYFVKLSNHIGSKTSKLIKK